MGTRKGHAQPQMQHITRREAHWVHVQPVGCMVCSQPCAGAIINTKHHSLCVLAPDPAMADNGADSKLNVMMMLNICMRHMGEQGQYSGAACVQVSVWL